MWFASDQKIDTTLNHGLSMYNRPLGEVQEYKYLGSWLDSALTFKHQLKETHNQVSAKLTQLKQVRYCLNQQDAVDLYKQAIIPILEYGDFPE